MITVKLFARLEEIVGSHTLQFDYSKKVVTELIQELEETHPVNLDTVMIAINEEYADRESTVVAGDTLAFIPPVSGG